MYPQLRNNGTGTLFSVSKYRLSHTLLQLIHFPYGNAKCVLEYSAYLATTLAKFWARSRDFEYDHFPNGLKSHETAQRRKKSEVRELLQV